MTTRTFDPKAMQTQEFEHEEDEGFPEVPTLDSHTVNDPDHDELVVFVDDETDDDSGFGVPKDLLVPIPHPP